MILQKLLEKSNYTIIQGDLSVDINGISYDSRGVKSGDIFFCIKGFKKEGHKYAKEAVKKGAKVIVCEEDIQLDNKEITIVKVEETRKALAIVSATFYNNPHKKMKMIGVTGTNGKTTTTFMIKSILEKEGHKVGLVGTISNHIGNIIIPSERTTPESLELYKLFNEMVERKCEYCVMEVSSHSLALDRVYGINFDVGIFTNLTRDHLDFHKTFENYYEAKLKLFKESSISIVNVDDNYGKRIIDEISGKSLSYSVKRESDYKAFNEKCESELSTYDINIKGKKETIKVGLPGEFNIYNSLGAIGASLALKVSVESIKNGIRDVVVTGRCEKVGKEYKLPYTIIIDYAHTPDGLENILTTVNGFKINRLISVFGCGGDRDKVKRPQMGKIGTELSEIAIITSDNPRTEDPMSIIDDIIKGINKNNYEVIENRKEAIKRAIDLAQAGDVIVIAGKGHETYQELKSGKIHFDEREIVDKILKEKEKEY